MIEIFDSRELHFRRCSERERRAAETVRNGEARRLHRELAEMFDRQAGRARRVYMLGDG